MSKGIYTKENVGNGAFIFTVNKNFVEPKFWGLHEENEQAQCVVIIHDGNALFFYPEDMDNDTHILLEQAEHFVKTDTLLGLSKDDVERAIKILNQ